MWLFVRKYLWKRFFIRKFIIISFELFSIIILQKEYWWKSRGQKAEYWKRIGKFLEIPGRSKIVFFPEWEKSVICTRPARNANAYHFAIKVLVQGKRSDEHVYKNSVPCGRCGSIKSMSLTKYLGFLFYPRWTR